MGFSTGNNLGGRTKGSKNKMTQRIRKAFTNLVNDNIESIQEDFQSLEPKDRIKLVLELSKFVLPTPKATELTGKNREDFEPIIITFDDPLPERTNEKKKDHEDQ